ncbi:hypothetical protein [Paraeggerthella sp.]|uniref:hypothetical protein n=1 Tax=Paraeggerthella sp. TaxID=2897350 RepID=UPI00352993BC
MANATPVMSRRTRSSNKRCSSAAAFARLEELLPPRFSAGEAARPLDFEAAALDFDVVDEFRATPRSFVLHLIYV